MRFLENRKGFTILEILMAVGLMFIIIMGVYLAYQLSSSSMESGEKKMEIQQNIRAGLDFMMREIRGIGKGLPVEIPNRFRILEANSSRISFLSADGNRLVATLPSPASAGSTTISVSSSSEISGNDMVCIVGGGKGEINVVSSVSGTNITLKYELLNGYPSGANIYKLENPSRIAYGIDLAEGQLTRGSDGDLRGNIRGGMQPVVDGVSSLSFQYYDSDGKELEPLPLNDSSRDLVRRIKVSMTIGGYKLSSDIKPRNLF
jgi:type II secretory pathway pseudopilin PulG